MAGTAARRNISSARIAIAALGCICITFDLRGHVRHQAMRQTVTREDNLRDVLAAYDVLVGHPAVDPMAIAIVGSSYGGYLAAILSSMRRVRWLALRVPALYRDEDWSTRESRTGARRSGRLPQQRRRRGRQPRAGRPAPPFAATCCWSSPSTIRWCRIR